MKEELLPEFKTKNRKVFGIRKYLFQMGFALNDHEEICDIFMFMVLHENESTWNHKGKLIQENFQKFIDFIKSSKYVETNFERDPSKVKSQNRKRQSK